MACFSDLQRGLGRVFLGEAEPSCMSAVCVELINLEKPSPTCNDTEHLNCNDVKHLQLFLILRFRSNSWK